MVHIDDVKRITTSRVLICLSRDKLCTFQGVPLLRAISHMTSCGVALGSKISIEYSGDPEHYDTPVYISLFKDDILEGSV